MQIPGKKSRISATLWGFVGVHFPLLRSRGNGD
jgi:hypothetical protein